MDGSVKRRCCSFQAVAGVPLLEKGNGQSDVLRSSVCVVSFADSLSSVHKKSRTTLHDTVVKGKRCNPISYNMYLLHHLRCVKY